MNENQEFRNIVAKLHIKYLGIFFALVSSKIFLAITFAPKESQLFAELAIIFGFMAILYKKTNSPILLMQAGMLMFIGDICTHIELPLASVILYGMVGSCVFTIAQHDAEIHLKNKAPTTNLEQK